MHHLISHALAYLSFELTSPDRYSYYFHFADEKTEALSQMSRLESRLPRVILGLTLSKFLGLTELPFFAFLQSFPTYLGDCSEN